MNTLISRAFDVFPAHIAGPDWIGPPAPRGAPRFDISAKLPEGASRDLVPKMLQALLEDRFKLTFHREVREKPGYALVVAKGGPKMKEAAPGAPSPLPAVGPDGKPPASCVAGGPRFCVGSSNVNGIAFTSIRLPDNGAGGGAAQEPTQQRVQLILMTTPSMGTVLDSTSLAGARIRHLEAPSISAQGLADLMTVIDDQGAIPVVDMTGLGGRYEVNLDVDLNEVFEQMDSWSELGDPPPCLPCRQAQLDAVQNALKKYGLQLQPRKTPVEYLVVDHVEKTPTNN
jgi:uncharacterized protein (TIGR03435 family)